MCSERFAISAVYKTGQADNARSTVAKITILHYTLLLTVTGHVRHLSLHVLSIYQRRCVMSTGFDGLVALGGRCWFPPKPSAAIYTSP